MKLNRIAIGGVAGIMGLGLIGIGAHATFTTTTTSHQTVSAGTLSVILHSTSATSGNTSKSITLAASPTNASSFTTGTITVEMINNGTVPATAITSTPGFAAVTAGSASTVLAHELYVCIVSTNVLYNGKLAAAGPQALGGTLAPTATTHYIINVYAGKEHTACGTATALQTPPAGGGTSTGASLTNAAEGGSVTVTETLAFTG